jgi:gamma-glutamyltranspeptidase/glutathione hydrolase
VLVGTAPFLAEAASPRPVVGEHGMVVAPDAYAAEAGLAVLEAGGSAVDAAVAATFVLTVTYPPAAPLGGGGFLLHRAADGRVLALDFREAAPRDLTAAHFLDEEQRPVPERARSTGLAVGVPGTVAGLALAHRRAGRLAWKRLLAPAIRLASDGFEISPWLASNLADEETRLRARPDTRELFTRAGRLLAEGDVLRQPQLAASLRLVAERGESGFYAGRTAEAIAASVAAAGGVLRARDLAEYRPALREPLVGHYRGHRVLAFPPPSGGGLALLQMLAMLAPYELEPSGFGSSRTVHLLAEVARRAFADLSRWPGDPDQLEIPLAGLLDESYLRARFASFRVDRATPSIALGPGEPPRAPDSGETLHLSVADASGGVVALTATLNSWYGSGIVARGTGILLNNEVDDFALSPGLPNQWGLVGGEANLVGGGKRPLSSMSPTIVEAPDGGPRPRLVLGSPGGPTIISSVLQVIVHVVDHELPLAEAVAAERFHHPWLPDEILHERHAFPEDVRQALERLGHELRVAEQPIGDVNAIGTDARGRWLGAPDPRRSSAARGY